MKTDSDIELLARIFNNAGFACSAAADPVHDVAMVFNCRNNPDGSVRWAWPSGCGRPHFLRFYSISSSRAGLFAKYTRLLFSLGFGKLLSNQCIQVYFSGEAAENILRLSRNEYSVFLGTPGPSRKGVICFLKDVEYVFIKVALTEHSGNLIGQERAALELVNHLALRYMRIPAIREQTGKLISLSDVCTPASCRSGSFGLLHAISLVEVYRKTAQKIPLHKSGTVEIAAQSIERLLSRNQLKVPTGMIRKMQYLIAGIRREEDVICTLSHGDFTPWNIFISDDQLQVCDWELSMGAAPALFDIFHFVFQSGVLLHRKPFEDIKRDLKAALELDPVKDYIRENNLDSELYFKLYLLINCSYYLDMYEHQAKWHVQVGWLLKAWNDALNDILVKEKVLSQRQLLSIDIFDFLWDKRYVALKWAIGRPEDLSLLSDIDICIGQEVRTALRRFLSLHPLVAHRRGYGKSFMCNHHIILCDGSILSIDAIWQFKRTSLEMMDATQLLNAGIRLKYGVKLPPTEVDFSYTVLFYILNRSSVPQKHRIDLNGHGDSMNDYLRINYVSDLTHYSRLYDYDPYLRGEVMERLKSRPSNRGWRKLLNTTNYYFDVLRDFLSHKGLVITFSGVDGAGKSTVIEQVRFRLEKDLRRKVVVLRHRPSLLPILSAWKYGKRRAEERTTATLPRQGTNNNRGLSLLRFLYYYLDYQAGQYYILLRYVWRGYTVLYDRYYFDFISDARRSNIRLSPRLVKWLYRFLLKPDLNFFLYASPEQILERKQELDIAAVQELTGKYMRLFYQLAKESSGPEYISMHNANLEKTVGNIYEHIKLCAR